MALPRVVSEIFNVEKYHDLEILVMNQSRSLKVVPFDSDVNKTFCQDKDQDQNSGSQDQDQDLHIFSRPRPRLFS